MSQAFALDIGFDRTGEILENQISGRVTLYCPGRIDNFSCYESGLIGGNRSKLFVKNGSIDADQVKLQRVGSRKVKVSKFYSKSGISKSNFNLWIGTLTQRPLLKRGQNTIRYRFYKKKQLVHEGEFDVLVTTNERRDCGWGTVSSRIMQCPDRYSVCNQFFRLRNYCRR